MPSHDTLGLHASSNWIKYVWSAAEVLVPTFIRSCLNGRADMEMRTTKRIILDELFAVVNMFLERQPVRALFHLTAVVPFQFNCCCHQRQLQIREKNEKRNT